MAGQMWDLAATPIGQAIQAGDVDELNRLVKAGENILFKDRKQNTFLHYVCTMYRPIIFYTLVAHGIDISAQNRHGNTALHVTALQHEACHVADLMTCGIDPAIQNKDGKTAEQLSTQNRYWHMIFEKYKPGIFHAVKEHDIPKIHQLLRCWIRVDCKYKKQTLRQYAACLKFHDIVVIIDEQKATTDMIYGVFEGNHNKVKEALKKTRCRVNFLNEISVKKHILQYCIKFKDLQFVQMLCDAGADVNTKIRVNNYFMGPLFFEAFHKDVPIEITWYILKSGADFTLKDERGRTAFMYALDKCNGNLPIEIFQYMLKQGADITVRDCTGCNPRDIARFARRRDVVDLIDKHYIKILRSSDMECLIEMAVCGYDSLMITHNYRDTFIYASGNESDEVLKFTQWLPTFQEEVKEIQDVIKDGALREMRRVFEYSHTPELIIRTRDKAMRTPLMLAVLYQRDDVVQFFLSSPYDVEIDGQDCCNRTAYHFACCSTSEVGRKIQEYLIDAGADTTLQNVRGETGEEFGTKRGPEFLEKEKKACYGMVQELACADKYEELRKIVRAKKKGLFEFQEFIRGYRFPVIGLCKVLSPLMPAYRDLIFLAIDYGKQDIARLLANLGANLSRCEKYERTNEDGSIETRVYTPAERAEHLGMSELGQWLSEREKIQREKLKHHIPLLPRRTIQTHFNSQFKQIKPSVFVTQSVM
ncbi:putative ankyrin repeat protein RF_0381 isoform X2 [Ruditapes philippinarum]|uniref:putative ankyrin repeat protein RF_0381 isoform X2 n=1 Tax=Ruditapes philippinarum TaxID=129788 RepID=UPI00295A8FEA|nr:putative ankyrin repeat protein RF_0381 isoform X2 [Ruditapes philippinarum]